MSRRGIIWRPLLLVVAMAGPMCVCEAHQWVRLGPEGGAVISLAAGANREVLLGTADGHIFASADAGMHWSLRGHVSSRWDAVVQKLLVDPSKPERVFAAVWYQDSMAGGGVFCSEDGGATWKLCGLRNEAVRALAQSEHDTRILVAGTKTGVFRTTDGGANWQRISPVGDEELRNLDSLAIDSKNPEIIYAGTYHLPWKTVDGGQHWVAVAKGMIDDSDIMSLAIDRGDAKRIFASACSGIYRSEDGGGHWTKLQGIPYSSRRTEILMQEPGEGRSWFAGTTEGLWKSADGGENWRRVTGRSVAIKTVAFADGGRKLLAGTEDGILAGGEGGEALRASNAGYSHPVLRSFLVAAGGTEQLIAINDETQKGLLESDDGGKTWIDLAPPAAPVAKVFAMQNNLVASLEGGGAAIFDRTLRRWKELRFLAEMPTRTPKSRVMRSGRTREQIVRPEVLASSAVGGRLFLATKGGLWSGGIREGVLRKERSEWRPKKIVDLTSDGTRLFAIADNTLWESDDSGRSWRQIPPPAGTEGLLWVRTAAGGERVLLGTLRGVYLSESHSEGESGLLWRLLQSGLPAAPSWPGWAGQELWIVPMQSGGVFLSRDEAQNWERLDDQATGLVRAVLGDGKGRIYVQSQTDGVMRLASEREMAEHSQNGTGHSSNSTKQ